MPNILAHSTPVLRLSTCRNETMVNIHSNHDRLQEQPGCYHGCLEPHRVTSGVTATLTSMAVCYCMMGLKTQTQIEKDMKIRGNGTKSEDAARGNLAFCN